MSAKSAVSVWNSSWTTTKRSSRARPRAHRVLLGRHRRRVRVVDEQRLHGRGERRVGQDAAELAHVERARAGRDEVGPLEGVRVHREGARGREQHAAAHVAPGPDHGGQAGDRAHRHPAAGVAVEAVVEADGRGPGGRVLAREAPRSPPPRRPVVAAARSGVHSRARARSSACADRVPLELVAVLEPVPEDDVHHPQRERGVRSRAGRQVQVGLLGGARAVGVDA